MVSTEEAASRHVLSHSRRWRLPPDVVSAAIFILPAAVLVAILMYYPMGRVLYDSLFKSTTVASWSVNPQTKFVGLEQYRDLVRDPKFHDVLRNSLEWTVAVVLFQNIIGLASAVLLNQRLPAKGLTRAVVLLPWVLPGVVNAVLWRFLYDPQLGLVNSVLISLGITDQKIAWLGDPGIALLALIAAAIWKGFPFSAVMYLAALQTVDHEQVEAAQIDGASALQRFQHVTIPAISGIIRLNLLLTTIWTFNYFDLIWVTTKGGPIRATHIFPTYIYEIGFGRSKFAEAAVYGVVAVVVLSVFAVLYIRELRRSEVL